MLLHFEVWSNIHHSGGIFSMKRKTVHAVVKYFYPVAAGIETNMMETYKAFVEKGWDVTIHTSTNTLTEKNILKSEEIIHGIHIKRYPFKWFGYIPNIPWETASVVAIHNFDIFPHMHILMHMLLRKIFNKRMPISMLTPHGGFTPDWEIFSPMSAFIKRSYHKTLGAWLINNTIDIIRTVSHWEKEEIIKYGGKKEKIIVLTNGLEDEAFVDIEGKASVEIKKRVKQFGSYMIQIGRIYNIKNYETTLNAMKDLPVNLNFVIVGPVGDEQYKKGLEELAKKLGIENRVFFAGVIRGVDKYYLIKHAELMVHMARWESFCNAVHEGMSQGKIVIVSDSYALPYLVKHNINGFCLPYNDVKGLTEKITYVLENKNSKDIRKIQQTNLDTTKHHSWRSVSLEVQKVLNQWLLN